jgi:Putative zinc dependent peptidase (DUF5700)
MRRLCAISNFAILFALAACAGVHARSKAPFTPAQLDVRLESEEADAALAILNKRVRGEVPATADWQRVLSSEGYQHLQERETSMGRAFTDSAFTAFLMSDTLLQRATLLDGALPPLEHLDVSAAAGRALKYLPAGTRIRARLYLEIKPITNSFVFTGRDSTPSIFLYVNPHESAAQLENTIAHELHHIGLNRACPDAPLLRATPAQRMLFRFLGAFGEGQAMLAAAGSPSIHPHASDDDTVQARWDRDVAHAFADVDELSRFFVSVLDGRVTSADSVQKQAFTYFGVQGPWYTVGWLMASSIERELGHDVLVRSLCEPTRFISLYNDAAKQANARGGALPTWNAELVNRLGSLRIAAD